MGANRRRLAVLVALATALLVCAVASPALARPLVPASIPPTAQFTISTPDTVGQAITFDASATTDPNGGSITAYNWDFGDGATDTTTSPIDTHTYAAAGSYTVTLTVNDTEHDTPVPTQQTLTVSQPPTAAFTFSTPDASGRAITFDASTSSDPNTGGSITNYSWDFGDGTTGTGVNPSHTYASGNTYTVTLTITDTEGGTDTTTQPITVAQSQPPTAAFTFAPATPGVGASVGFDATGSSDPNSGGSITNYSWDFGDGHTGTGATPSHAYAHGGTFSVTLTITDAEGGTATVTNPVPVNPALAPSASFTVSSAAEGAPATFDASTSSDPNPGGSIVSYAWDFGDGSTATGVAPSHTYAAPGSYSVVLTVTDTYGASAISTQTVPVSDAPESASFSASPSSPAAGTPITFAGTRTGDPDDLNVTYSWVFGDGATASSASASTQHAYALPGTYTVVLTIVDDDGSATISQRVTVAPGSPPPPTKPTAAFSAPTGREGVAVNFDGSRSRDPNAGGSLSYRWDFGDGGVGAGAKVSHTFRAGTWTVALTVTDSATSLSATTSHRITIADERPSAGFTAPSASAGVPARFRGSGTDRDGTITAYRWRFGDGSRGTGRTVRHTYAKPGRYRVTLTVIDSSGQSATVSHPITVGSAHACLVPKLAGMAPPAARRALGGAHCSIGHVTTPPRPARGPGNGKSWQLVVARQSPRAGAVRAKGAAVSLTLAWRAM